MTSSPSTGESFSQPMRQAWACSTAQRRSARTGPSKRRTWLTSMPVDWATSSALAPARMSDCRARGRRLPLEEGTSGAGERAAGPALRTAARRASSTMMLYRWPS